MPTHYENLHVTEDAPDEVIRASYRALSLKHHPDKAGDRPASKWKMQRINDAYAVLSDGDRRAGYDAELRRARQPQPSVPVTPFADLVTPRVAPPRHHRHSHSSRIWMRGTLGWLSDARIVLPVVLILWCFVYWMVSRK